MFFFSNNCRCERKKRTKVYSFQAVSNRYSDLFFFCLFFLETPNSCHQTFDLFFFVFCVFSFFFFILFAAESFGTTVEIRDSFGNHTLNLRCKLLYWDCAWSCEKNGETTHCPFNDTKSTTSVLFLLFCFSMNVNTFLRQSRWE